MLGVASSLEVISPSQGLTVVSERSYTVEWTGTGSNSRFTIDLFFCGDMCSQDECGEWVTALCPYGEDGCPDNEGDYDVFMPQPMADTSGSGYKVRVENVADETEYDCSDEFMLMASEEVDEPGMPGGPTLEVTSPSTGDVAIAGDEYTVEFDFDNGYGSPVGRFAIDLFMAGGNGDCGTFFSTICDKPSIGCRDTMGDYDVTIPENAPDGDYRIRVGDFSDDEVFGCSDMFEVVGGQDPIEGSMSFDFDF